MTLPLRNLIRTAGQGRPGGLGRRIGLNGLSQIVPLLTNFALTPYLIRVLGVDGFGVWSLVLVFLSTLTTLDGGVGASLSRFFAIHASRGDREGAGRLLLGAFLVFACVALVVSSLSFALAGPIVHHLHMKAALRPEALATFKGLGPLVGLALLSESGVALLQANDRFGRLWTATAASSVVYCAAVFICLDHGHPLQTLVWLTGVRYLMLALFTLGSAGRSVRLTSRWLPDRQERKRFRAYALRMQMSSLTSFFNGEIDAFIVAALLPVRYVGLYAAGFQVAIVARSLPLYAFPPVLTRLSHVFGTDGLSGARDEFNRLERFWILITVGYGAVATCAVGLGVPIWLGPKYDLAGVIGAVLMAGYTVHVALTGVRTCFVRAVGRPGLELRYSVLSTVVNLALTVPFALAFGAVGVVAATAIGLVVASAYFVRLCRPFGLHEQRAPGTWWVSLLVALAITAAGDTLVLGTNWRGTLPLICTAIPALLGLTVLRRSTLPLLRPAASPSPTGVASGLSTL